MRRKSLLVPMAISLAMLGVSCGENILGTLPDVAVVHAPIVFEADGSVRVPEFTVVVQGQSVRWFQVGGDSLSIHLEAVPGIGGTQSDPESVVVAITTETRPGNYKYDVTVWRVDEAFRVDPRLIVRPR